MTRMMTIRGIGQSGVGSAQGGAYLGYLARTRWDRLAHWRGLSVAMVKRSIAVSGAPVVVGCEPRR